MIISPVKPAGSNYESAVKLMLAASDRRPHDLGTGIKVNIVCPISFQKVKHCYASTETSDAEEKENFYE